MSLWPHQIRALQEIDRAVTDGKRAICLTIPTGGGKTRVLFEHLTREGATTAAVYTDRRMLLAQIAQGMEQAGISFGFRAAGHETRLLDDVQLCMAQTEVSRVLKGKREIHAADWTYIDEAHKNSGDTMVALLGKHREVRPDMVTLLLTATPLGIAHVADHLIVAGTNSQLRDCGALVKAFHYGPDEPDTKWVGKVAVGEGECGLAQQKRMEFATRVFGSVVEHYSEYNPDLRPSLLFAPGVKESIWFAEELCHNGISAAHIDGENVWLNGELRTKDDDVIEYIAREHEAGNIRIVCNRFVLREGINWPWVYHGIFATVFGSLTSYIQAGGRLLRAHPGKDHCVIQDHGGNWWRHGSLNSDREWSLESTDRIEAGMREQKIRERKEPEPIVCAKCHAVRNGGPQCHACGHKYQTKSRMVLQKNGTLREMKGDIFRKRRLLTPSQHIEQEWCSRVAAVRKSKKPTVQRMTFAQVEASFARDHNWQYPPHTLPMMPVKPSDWFRPVSEVQELSR
jgi:DNA repair protein RadD